MIGPGHILFVDDDRAFLRMYREIYEQEGLEVSTAASADQAIAIFEAVGASLDVVVIDQKLQGRSGPDDGLELIVRSAAALPFAKSIVVTGYATRSAMDRALHLGVYAYLSKTVTFEEMLRTQVSNAIEVTRAKREAAMRPASVVHKLRMLWPKVRTEADRNRKGWLLEEMVRLLFQATPGFGRVTARLANGIEEIDIVIENQASELPWKDEGAYLLGECKNWSSTCGTAELRDFRGKLTAKNKRVRTGFLIAPGGFSVSAYEDVRSHKESDLLLILVDGSDLERWIMADDRLEVLRSLHERAVFDLKR